MSENIWHKSRAIFKENKAVVKLRNGDGSFKKSVIIPTVYYPLNGKYEVFISDNTMQIEDKAVLDVFNSVKYRIGQCYTNTGELVEKLVKAGYDAKSYAGWVFTGVTQFPIHHCWTVLNGNVVLDLSDDYTVMLGGENGKNFAAAQSVEEQRELIADFQAAAAKVPNSVRCHPVGKATSFLLYVGCECSPDDAVVIYRNLIRQFPDHECQRNCDSTGLNATQKVMREKGLM